MSFGNSDYGLAPYGEPFLNHQWQLLSDDNEVALTFGTVDTGFQTASAPDLGQRDIRVQDIEAPREDGGNHGVDYHGGTTITFELNVLGDSWEAQSDQLDQFLRTWRDERFRNASGRYGILQVQHAGRIRRCYGRPRRAAGTDEDLTHEGYTGLIADFATRDGKFYDEDETVLSVSSVLPTFYGLTDPLTDPLTMPTPTTRPATLSIAGQPTWVRVVFHGPCTNPVVDLGDFKIKLNATIAAQRKVTVDPRPWSRGVLGSGNVNFAGSLSHDTPPLRQLKLTPGERIVNYSCTDPTGTSFVEVAFRNCYDRP